MLLQKDKIVADERFWRTYLQGVMEASRRMLLRLEGGCYRRTRGCTPYLDDPLCEYLGRLTVNYEERMCWEDLLWRAEAERREMQD